MGALSAPRPPCRTASYTELCETAGLQVPFNDGSIKAIAQQMSQWIAEHQV